MHFPTYWARRDFTSRGPRGRPITRSALGWSDVNQGEAEQLAQQRAERAASTALAGTFDGYDYGHVPTRETVLETLTVAGETIAVVTRNRYGCRVLNTDRVMFADVDLPWVEQGQPRSSGWFRRLFAKRTFVPASDAEALQRIAAWQADRPQVAMRVYRTFAGIRLLFTDRQYDPTEPLVPEVLNSLGGDQLYLRLTMRQKTFRARLTPKPWRCGVAAPPQPSQINHPDWAERLETWARSYEPIAASFATCRLVEELGQPAKDPVIEAVVALHDRQALGPGHRLA